MGEGGSNFQIGKSDNIMRDEVNFSKFVPVRMRKKFCWYHVRGPAEDTAGAKGCGDS